MSREVELRVWTDENQPWDSTHCLRPSERLEAVEWAAPIELLTAVNCWLTLWLACTPPRTHSACI